ncbi:hypothetical protein H0H92_009093 [Tricholoma furcatifolium]|nr:hypothetical protein H0H92_009093 [Tricholoma furcatifolium]
MRNILAISSVVLTATSVGLAQENPIVYVGSTATATGGVYQFIPPVLNVTNGTTITFKFTGAPGNHSVTQSSFANPCEDLSGGFDSGWVFIPANNVSASPEWNLTITNASTPLWFYCKQLVPLTHCSAGMVGAINAPGSGNHTFANFQSNAKSFQGPSGQGEGSLVGQGAFASAGPGPQASGASFYTAPTATAPSSSSATSTASPSASPNAALAHGGNPLVVMLGGVIGMILSVV